MTRVCNWVVAILLALDILVNAILGGERYETLSCRIGLNIQDGGWASYVPWPNWLKQHFLKAIFEALV